MTRIAIIGGGISGLAAAFELETDRSAGVDVEYVLYEASPRLGGVLRTEYIDGCVVEAGPDSFITEKPWAAELCRALGLADQLIGSNDADRKTYILTKGRLVVMPDGLMFMVPTKILPTGLSSLFSWKTKLRMTQELFHPPRAVDHDESVAAFVERHYGAEMVDRLADPLLSGVYGGEAASLSVRAVLPRFAEMERTHGSLGRAMLAARKKAPAGPRKPAPTLFTSLKNGMQHLAETAVSRLTPTALLTNAPVQALQREAGSWVVSAGCSLTSAAPPTTGSRSPRARVPRVSNCSRSGVPASCSSTTPTGRARSAPRARRRRAWSRSSNSCWAKALGSTPTRSVDRCRSLTSPAWRPSGGRLSRRQRCAPVCTACSASRCGSGRSGWGRSTSP